MTGEAFLRLLQQFEAGGHAQFIIATHSPILLAYPGAHIFSFDSSCVQEVAYEDTSHYKIYKHFFTDRTAFLDGSDAFRPSEDKSIAIEKEVCR